MFHESPGQEQRQKKVGGPRTTVKQGKNLEGKSARLQWENDAIETKEVTQKEGDKATRKERKALRHAGCRNGAGKQTPQKKKKTTFAEEGERRRRNLLSGDQKGRKPFHRRQKTNGGGKKRDENEKHCHEGREIDRKKKKQIIENAKDKWK